MIVKLLGCMPLNFTSADGKSIVGKSLYVAFEANGVEGFKCDKVFANSDITLPAGMKINDILDLSFNMKGKLESVAVSNPKA